MGKIEKKQREQIENKTKIIADLSHNMSIIMLQINGLNP